MGKGTEKIIKTYFEHDLQETEVRGELKQRLDSIERMWKSMERQKSGGDSAWNKVTQNGLERRMFAISKL